jgi:hypothetical protein
MSLLDKREPEEYFLKIKKFGSLSFFDRADIL